MAHKSCHNPNKADKHSQPLRAEAGSDFFIHDRRGKALYLCSNVFSTKVQIKDIYVSDWRRDSYFTWSPAEPRESLAVCTTKAVPSSLGVLGVLSEVGMNTCSVRLFVRVEVLQNFVFYAVKISPAAC